MFKSQLDDIKGIGKKRKMELLRHFGSINKIQSASILELIEVKGMNKSVAEELFNHFNKKSEKNE